MKKLLFLLTALVLSSSVSAQRIQQKLGRGVVAVQNGTAVTITWRKLAQEPENAKYNVYVNGTKVNSSPLTRTNWQTTKSVVPTGAKVSVTLVTDGNESAPSTPFTVKNFDCRNIYADINFEQGGSPLTSANYGTAYVWPCDLDGDGEMDFVVNRKSVTNEMDAYVEGYLRTGEHLWTVKLGPNELSCAGQDDQITACDIDCDGYGEVIIQSSDGTQFWDPDKKDFGLYVNGNTTADTDGDGIIDYEKQNVRNAPRYMSVINGMTGREKASVEQTYTSDYTRTNRASLMGDEYNKHVGHVGVFYHDGIHPAVVMEWHTRESNGTHHYHNSAWAYDYDSDGKATNWHQLFCEQPGGPAFHMIRIGDPDGDGKDEMIVGGYTMDHNGKTLFNTGIAHGDRFRTSDIDPERPGLETFAIQQYAPDMLGCILYDAKTGEAIKKWYLNEVSDVGRGEAMDIDKSHLGWELWSTMDGMWDAKGNKIENLSKPYPTEGIWWDSEPDREIVQSSDSHYNVYIQDFFNGREIEIAKLSGYRYVTVYAKRAAFWGDIIGDWREELVLLHKENGVCVGVTAFSTDYPTTINNIYCLQEDPHYRGDCSTKGYYQSPNPGFYLGYDMPRPQLPPCMVTDVVAKADNTFTNYQRGQAVSLTAGKSVLYDLTLGNATLATPSVATGTIYAMPVSNQVLTLTGDITGTCDLWKSQQGTLVLTGNNTSTGTTYISEGTLQVDGSVSGAIELRARGTLSGSGTVNNVILEGAMNYEGGRFLPTGVLTVNSPLLINKKTFVELSIGGTDLLKVNGDLTVSAPLIFTINASTTDAGEYKLVEFTGSFSGDSKNLSVRGIMGLSYDIKVKDNGIFLVINSQRDSANGVKWTGAENGTWDYQTENFTLDGEATSFVANDGLVFDDSAVKTTIQVAELMPITRAEVNTDKTYTFSGDGGFSGDGMLVKNGSGKLILNNTNSDYTGATVINEGSVTVKELMDAGMPSSIGAATSSPDNFRIGKATLIVNNTNTSTNRGITLNDTATVQLASGTLSFKGLIKGNGTLVKTGAGQLNITYAGANQWKSTILKAGTLAMGAYNTTFGTSTSSIRVTGNSTIGMFETASSSNAPTFNNTVIVEKGATLNFNAGSRCSVRGSLQGEGTYKINFPYVRGDVYTNCSQFEGIYSVSGQQWRLRQAIDLSKATLTLGAGVYAAGYSSEKNEGNYTHKIGALTATATDCTLSTGTWNIGYLGTNDTYAGTFNANATVNKYGDGVLTLTGASAGPLSIYAGEVQAQNTSAPITTGTITVRNGGLLDGTGQVKNVTVQNGGTIGAGKASSTLISTLTVTGNLTLNSGANLRVRTRTTAARTTADAFKVAGNVRLNSPVITVTEQNSDFSYDDNTELPIFTGTGNITISGDITILPTTPKAGCMWDTSTLATDGILRIVPDPTAIRSITADQLSADDKVFDINGRPIKRIIASGTYIVNGQKVFIEK